MRHTVRYAWLGLAPVLALLGACASSTPGGPASPAPPTDSDTRYAAQATILQPADSEPMLCLGGVMESYPPQCGGPVVVGLDWDDVPDAETASGVTWGSAWVVGTYDGETFTLTEPARETAPDGVDLPGPGTGPAFAPLCADPWRGGDEDALTWEEFDVDAPEREDAERYLSPESQELVGQLQELAAALPGFVELYVSDGQSEFNVLLTPGSDVAAAHASLREVWPGWLCVATTEHEAPSNQDAMAASDALGAAFADPYASGILGWGPNTIAGTFDVSVILETPELRDRITEALTRWYTPDQVVLNSALIQLP